MDTSAYDAAQARYAEVQAKLGPSAADEWAFRLADEAGRAREYAAYASRHFTPDEQWQQEYAEGAEDAMPPAGEVPEGRLQHGEIVAAS